MKVGQVGLFSFRLSDGNIATEQAQIISTDRVASDGIQVVEVEFRDGKIRKYSGQFLKEERL